MFRPLWLRLAAFTSNRILMRRLLFLYTALTLCPIQYWWTVAGLDATWLFALNNAAAQHLLMGRDIVWTSGPLSYLASPQDIGNNLALGLGCQVALWILA